MLSVLEKRGFFILEGKMKLIINEFGSYLSKRENRFVVKNKDKQEEYSADQVEQIIT